VIDITPAVLVFNVLLVVWSRCSCVKRWATFRFVRFSMNLMIRAKCFYLQVSV